MLKQKIIYQLDAGAYKPVKAHEADAGFRPRNRRVDQISRHQHPRSRMDRDHHCRIFASLGFVDRDRVGKLQLCESTDARMEPYGRGDDVDALVHSGASHNLRAENPAPVR